MTINRQREKHHHMKTSTRKKTAKHRKIKPSPYPNDDIHQRFVDAQRAATATGGQD